MFDIKLLVSHSIIRAKPSFASNILQVSGEVIRFRSIVGYGSGGAKSLDDQTLARWLAGIPSSAHVSVNIQYLVVRMVRIE